MDAVEREQRDTMPFLQPESVEIAKGESELSLGVQAIFKLRSIFYEVLANELHHQLRAILPRAFFKTEARLSVFKPIFPDDLPSVRALNDIPSVPQTITEAREVLGINQYTTGVEVMKRFFSFSLVS